VAQWDGQEPRWFYELNQVEQVRAIATWRIAHTDSEKLDKIRQAAKRQELRDRFGV